MDTGWIWYLAGAMLLAVMAFALWRAARLAFRLWKAKMAAQTLATAVATGAYVMSPVDAIPDIVFGIGWLDDVLVIMLAIYYLRRLWLSRRERPVAAANATIEVVPEVVSR